MKPHTRVRSIAGHVAIAIVCAALAGCGPVQRASDGPPDDRQGASGEPEDSAPQPDDAAPVGLDVVGAEPGIEPFAGIVPATIVESDDGPWLALDGQRLVPIDVPAESVECGDTLDPTVALVAPASGEHPRTVLALYTDGRAPRVWVDAQIGDRTPCWHWQPVFMEILAEPELTLAVDFETEPLAFEAVDAFPTVPGPEVVSLGLHGFRIDPGSGDAAIATGSDGIPVDLDAAIALDEPDAPPWLPHLRPASQPAKRPDGETGLNGDPISDAWAASVPLTTGSHGAQTLAEPDDIAVARGLREREQTSAAVPDLDQTYTTERTLGLGRQPGGLLIEHAVLDEYRVVELEERTEVSSGHDRWFVLDDLRTVHLGTLVTESTVAAGEHASETRRTDETRTIHWVASTLADDPGQFDDSEAAWIEHVALASETEETWWSFRQFENVAVDGEPCAQSEGTADGTRTETRLEHRWILHGPDGTSELNLAGIAGERVLDFAGGGTIGDSQADSLLESVSDTIPGLGELRVDLNGEGVVLTLLDPADQLVVSGTCADDMVGSYDVRGDVVVHATTGGLYLVSSTVRFESWSDECTEIFDLWWRPGLGVVGELGRVRDAIDGQTENCVER